MKPIFLLFILALLPTLQLSSQEKMYTVEVMMVEYLHGDGFNWGIDISNGKIKNVDGISFNPGSINKTGNYTRGTNPNGIEQLQFNISALSEMNIATVVQNPRVSVKNGEKATITLKETRYIKQKEAGFTGTSFSLGNISAPIELIVTPRESNNFIELEVDANLAEFIDKNDSVDDEVSFFIESNEVNSKVNVSNGETYIIGGLIKENINTVNRGIPLLKNIPFIGKLFSQITDVTSFRELVIYITVYEGLNKDANLLYQTQEILNDEDNFYKWVEQNKKNRKEARKRRRVIKKEFKN